MGIVEPIELMARREALGLSQVTLGELLGGVKQATIAHWERGARPIPPGITAEVARLEETQDNLAATLADAAGDSGQIALPAASAEGLPVGFQRVAAANALRDLRSADRPAAIVGDS